MVTTLSLFDVDDLAEHPTGPLVRVRMTVAYDGRRFHGFALSPGVPTVAGLLAEMLERALRHPVELTCAGRTDKGVHAHGQVVDFLTSDGVDLAALARSLNSLCSPDVAVRDLVFVDAGFSSRFDAIGRRYRYTIHNAVEPDPFSTATAWHVDQPLDLTLLRLATDPFIGSHDFTSFCRKPKRPAGEEADLVRRVRSAQWERDGDTFRFWIESSSFCHQMVRAIVGTLVDVGVGRTRAGEMAHILASRDRSLTGPVAPPHGLTLWQVLYPEE